MADKPIARRLDDIEEKMNRVLETNNNIIEHFDGFQDNLSSVDTNLIQKTMKQTITNTMQSSNSMPKDWLELVSYCIEKDISADTMMQFSRILSGDHRKDEELKKL